MGDGMVAGIAILLLVGIYSAFVIRRKIRDVKAGKYCSCSGCSGCAGGCGRPAGLDGTCREASNEERKGV